MQTVRVRSSGQSCGTRRPSRRRPAVGASHALAGSLVNGGTLQRGRERPGQPHCLRLGRWRVGLAWEGPFPRLLLAWATAAFPLRRQRPLGRVALGSRPAGEASHDETPDLTRLQARAPSAPLSAARAGLQSAPQCAVAPPLEQSVPCPPGPFPVPTSPRNGPDFRHVCSPLAGGVFLTCLSGSVLSAELSTALPTKRLLSAPFTAYCMIPCIFSAGMRSGSWDLCVVTELPSNLS